MIQNRTWLAFANRKKCRHADAIHNLGFISWKMGRARFSLGDIVLTAENCKREDQAYWVETPPNDITYKLELLEEYDGTKLNESVLCEHGFTGGNSLEGPICKNEELLNYIKSIF